MNPEGRNKEGAIGGEEAPCSSLAVDSILRIGTAGLIWGLCFGPYGAGKLGLTGVARASFVAKSAGRHGFQFVECSDGGCCSRCCCSCWLPKLETGCCSGRSCIRRFCRR
ncbi:uncharacterized protein LOC127798372 isoform X4 [Diospyros lotus]|uniref:uncharacterized protein LOC127798372 isoform X4 n=1 Tax=Diospyros lotus TaxID=55363 RepID=UPI002256D7D8|nr:uncharacterized protein LOC127798372 isoform X4 [Diospyros lotus]